MKITIKKGNHYSNVSFFRKIIPHEIDKTERVFNFDKSCLDNNRNDQINKLFGFTIGLCSPKWNSVRFGFVPNKESISIYSFCHQEGRMIYNINKPLKICYPDIDYYGCIDFCFDKYNFIIRELSESEDEEKMEWSPIYRKHKYGFSLFPYNGGTVKALHDYSLILRKI